MHEVTLRVGTGTLCLKTETLGGALLLWHHCSFRGAPPVPLPPVVVPAFSQRPVASPYDPGLCVLGSPSAAGSS